MKKILLSLLMLCTTICAWSQTTYTTNTITLNYVDCDESYITTNAETGIYVTAPKADNIACWQADKYNPLQLEVPDGYVITAVKINYLNKSYLEAQGITGSSIDICDNLVLNGETWEQKDGAFSRITMIRFRTATGTAYVRSVTITYHKHTFTHDEAVAATCVAPGKKESWTCSDCGRTYYDEKGAKEVAEPEDLILPIDPTNHASTLTKHEAVAATCVSTGNVQYWHCSDCDHCFKDEAGATQIAGDNVTTDIDPNNHAGKLKEVAFKNASVVEDGVYHHWHCEACSNDYADADGTEDMNGKTVKAKYDADALLVGNTTVDESYLFDGAKVTFDGDKVNLTIGSDKHAYNLSETERLMIGFSHTFKLTANQDLNNTENYYSTFYTSEGAYKLPDGAKAYVGALEKSGTADILKLTGTELIHQSEPVILKAAQSSITLMPSCNKDAASTGNKLSGTEEGIASAPENVYALSLGQNGVGFYNWSGRTIGANKAYLTLPGSSLSAPIRSFGMVFDDGTVTGILATIIDQPQDDIIYNLQGQRVDESYRGLIIKNGQKVYNY